MRVLCVGNMYPPHDLGGGYEVTWRASVLHLRARGHEVRVLVTDYRAPALDASDELDPEVYRELRWYWRDHGFPRLPLRARIALERHNAESLERQLASFRPDVVAWWGMGGMSLGLIEQVRRAGTPAVGVVGDEWLRWGPRADGWLKPLQRRPRLAALAERATGLPGRVDFDGAALWLFNSDWVRESSRSGESRLPLSEVAHPGIDTSIFRPAPPRPWRWRLLYVGRLDRRKGVHLAIEALALLPPEATLVIQGGGDEIYADHLHTLANQRGLAARIDFRSGPRAQIGTVYAAADALLFPVQWEEPWGLVPLEAMAVGTPVIATGTGGSREYLRNQSNCLIYEPRDSADALAAAVYRLAEDDDLRERLRAGGLQTAAMFTEAAYNEAIEKALQTASSWHKNL